MTSIENVRGLVQDDVRNTAYQIGCQQINHALGGRIEKEISDWIANAAWDGVGSLIWNDARGQAWGRQPWWDVSSP